MAFYQTYPPSPHLAHVVEHYWRAIVTLGESLIQDVPTPLMQGMTFNLDRLTEHMIMPDGVQEMTEYCYLFGQPAHHRLSKSNDSGINIFGIKFTPTGLYTLTQIEMQELVDSLVPGQDVWGREIEWLCEALYEAPHIAAMIQRVEHFLWTKINQHPSTTAPSLEYALQYMQTNKVYAVKDIREKVYLSERTMQRHFLRHIGMTPKQYARICRYNAVRQHLLESDEPDWLEAVYTFGYHDQSHFIKEFKEFAGTTPAQYADTLVSPSLKLF